MPTALITGINGQDGSYLAELLVGAGYSIIGTVRQAPTSWSRFGRVREAVQLIDAAVPTQELFISLLEKYSPSEVYNLAALSNSALPFAEQVAGGQRDGLAVVQLLEAIRLVNPAIRFCQASTSELFGNACESPQRETTPFCPRNPYGVAKLYGHWNTVTYRDNIGIFACSAILFNHVSARHSDKFVIRKISRGAARIKKGLQDSLLLGYLDAQRDWGYASDYVRAMWRMLQVENPADYVIATGRLHSVRDVCAIAFGHLDLNYRDYVVPTPELRRPGDSTSIVGDPTKAEQTLDLRPTVTFEELVSSMVDADMADTSPE